MTHWRPRNIRLETVQGVKASKPGILNRFVKMTFNNFVNHTTSSCVNVAVHNNLNVLCTVKPQNKMNGCNNLHNNKQLYFFFGRKNLF